MSYHYCMNILTKIEEIAYVPTGVVFQWIFSHQAAWYLIGWANAQEPKMESLMGFILSKVIKIAKQSLLLSIREENCTEKHYSVFIFYWASWFLRDWMVTSTVIMKDVEQKNFLPGHAMCTQIVVHKDESYKNLETIF